MFYDLGHLMLNRSSLNVLCEEILSQTCHVCAVLDCWCRFFLPFNQITKFLTATTCLPQSSTWHENTDYWKEITIKRWRSLAKKVPPCLQSQARASPLLCSSRLPSSSDPRPYTGSQCRAPATEGNQIYQNISDVEFSPLGLFEFQGRFSRWPCASSRGFQEWMEEWNPGS